MYFYANSSGKKRVPLPYSIIPDSAAHKRRELAFCIKHLYLNICLFGIAFFMGLVWVSGQARIQLSATTLTQTERICAGCTLYNNGSFTFSAITNGAHFVVSTINTGTYDDTAFAGTAISLPQIVKTGAPNTGEMCIAQVLNGANDYSTGETATVNPVTCIVPCPIPNSRLVGVVQNI
jgi:hypothetical protein